MSNTDNTGIDKALEILNRAYKADPGAIHALVCNHVPCNKALADDPDVIVEAVPAEDDRFRVGPFGVLNGILEAITGSRAALQFSDGPDQLPKRLLGFVRFNEKEPA